MRTGCAYLHTDCLDASEPRKPCRCAEVMSAINVDGGRYLIDPRWMREPWSAYVIEYDTPGRGWQVVKWWPEAGVVNTLENARIAISDASIPSNDVETSQGFRIILKQITVVDHVIDELKERT